MRVVYDPSHVLHNPVTEVQNGVAMAIYEMPARVESIRAALLADDADPAPTRRSGCCGLGARD